LGVLLYHRKKRGKEKALLLRSEGRWEESKHYIRLRTGRKTFRPRRTPEKRRNRSSFLFDPRWRIKKKEGGRGEEPSEPFLHTPFATVGKKKKLDRHTFHVHRQGERKGEEKKEEQLKEEVVAISPKVTGGKKKERAVACFVGGEGEGERLEADPSCHQPCRSLGKEKGERGKGNLWRRCRHGKKEEKRQIIVSSVRKKRKFRLLWSRPCAWEEREEKEEECHLSIATGRGRKLDQFPFVAADETGGKKKRKRKGEGEPSVLPLPSRHFRRLKKGGGIKNSIPMSNPRRKKRKEKEGGGCHLVLSPVTSSIRTRFLFRRHGRKGKRGEERGER